MKTKTNTWPAASLELQSRELHYHSILAAWRERNPGFLEIDLGRVHMASHKPSRRIEHAEPDEIILGPNTKWQLEFYYPLTTAVRFHFVAPAAGHTRKEVVNAIAKAYKQIYAEEKQTSTIKAATLPQSFNRNLTNGKYGIWGHVLGDLILHTLYMNGNTLAVVVDS